MTWKVRMALGIFKDKHPAYTNLEGSSMAAKWSSYA